jgi:hypothetical protein
MLSANATIVRLDSRKCKAFETAIERMDAQQVTWRADVQTVGQDTREIYPPPHSIRVVWSLDIVTPGGGPVTLEGSGQDFYDLVSPVMKAADDCEAAGAHTVSTNG